MPYPCRQNRSFFTTALAACGTALALIVSCAPTGNVKTPEAKPNPNAAEGDADVVAVAVKPRVASPAIVEEKAGSAHSWPTFFGSPSRNPFNTVEKNIPTEWSIAEGAEKNIKWVQTCGSKSYAGPVFAGGRIFVGMNNQKPRDPSITGDKGVLLCLDEKTGDFLWQAIYDKLPGGRVVDWPLQGICSTPHVDGDRVYFINNRCEVVCADVAGNPETKKVKEIWKLDMMKELGVFPHNLACSSPLVVGDLLFVITSNGVDEDHIDIPNPKAPSFLTLDKKTGKVLWSDNSPSVNMVKAREGARKGPTSLKDLVDRGLVLMHGQWSSPAYAEVNGQGQVIFPGGDGWLYAFEPKAGKLIWKFDANPKGSHYELGPQGTRNDFIATPCIHDNRLYIGVGQDPEHKEGVGHLWCIDITKQGDVSPELVVDDSALPPKTKPNPNSAAVWQYGGYVNPRPKRGRPYSFGRTISTCCVHDGLVYAGELGGYLHCLDAKTGEKYWEHDMRANTWSSPYYVDGKIYMGDDKSKVLVFKHGKKKELIATNLLEGKVCASPVAVNGVLYVMTEEKLYAIENKGK
jgi:outer membrane protein assembly factor BamB